MKHTFSLLIATSLIAVSCGSADELEKKKTELTKYKTELQELKTKISDTEKEILALDPDFGKKENASALVTTLTMNKAPFFHKFEVRGTVASRKNILISPETSGKIEAVRVSEGQRVSAGQVLAVLDGDILRNSIAEVKTSLEFATTLFEKQERLYKQNIGTEVQYLQAKNNKESLERKLTTLQSQLDMTIVKAPFSGVVDQVNALVGELASPQKPVFRMVNPDNVYIKADVSERFIGTFKKGDKVEVYFPVNKQKVASTISSVGSVINSENRTFEVEVTVPKTKFGLNPNMVAVLKIKDYENKEALAVPTHLIQADNKGKFVYTVENNHAVKTYVTPGISFNNISEITSGLEVSQQVVDKGFRELADGVSVKIKEANEAKEVSQALN